METMTLQAEVRESRGKGPARRLRKQGQVPAVFYGPGIEPTPLSVSPKELTTALRGERGRNVVFTLSYGGKQELAMVKDLTTDPVTLDILHVDLYRIFEDRELDVLVPFKTKGRAIGVVQGGVLNITRRHLPLRATPDKIPTTIEVDVSDLDMHDSISVKDIPLAEGVTCSLKPDLTLAVVAEERRAAIEEEEEAAAAAAAAAEGVEGEAAPTPEGEAAPGTETHAEGAEKSSS